jgi:hypothetical protein
MVFQCGVYADHRVLLRGMSYVMHGALCCGLCLQMKKIFTHCSLYTTLKTYSYKIPINVILSFQDRFTVNVLCTAFVHILDAYMGLGTLFDFTTA